MRQGHAIILSHLEHDLGKRIPALSKIQQVSFLNWQLVRYPIYPDTSAVQGYNPFILIREKELFYSFLSQISLCTAIINYRTLPDNEGFYKWVDSGSFVEFFIFRNAHNKH